MKIKKEAQIGLLAIMALALGYIGVNFLKGIELFKKSSTYYAHFDNLSSVTVATPVMVSGYKVGTVREVSFDYTKGHGATVELSLDPQVQVSSQSELKIKMNPLSGSELVLTIGQGQGQPLSEGDTIPTISPKGDLLSVASDQILPSIAGMMPTITATLERLNALLQDKALDSMLIALQGTSQQLQQMTANLNHSSRQLSPIMNQVSHMSSNLATFSDQLAAMRLDSLMGNLQQTTGELAQVAGQLRKKDNTAGLLLNDPSLYNRLDSLVLSADRLMRDLKENPKRYVHLSVF